MEKNPIEVRNGHTSFEVMAQAESIQQAVNLVRSRYPGNDVKIKFPINPKNFLINDSTARAGVVGFEGPIVMAA